MWGKERSKQLLTVFVLEVVVLSIDHVLLVEGLADLTLLILALPIAVPGAISHFLSNIFRN